MTRTNELPNFTNLPHMRTELRPRTMGKKII
jgi:hypothetical protein